MTSRIMLPVLLATLSCANAEPDWAAELTSPSPGPHPTLSPVALDFRISWKGMIDSGTLRMEFTPLGIHKPGFQVVRSTAASKGPAVALFPYQHRFWSELHATTLRPRYFEAVEKNDEETVTTTVRYLADRVESEESSRAGRSGKVETKTRVFKRAPVFDIYSAMLHVRSQKLDKGDRITLVIQPFDSPYLLRVRSLGPEIHEGRKAIKLSVGMAKISRKTLELQPYAKLKSDAVLWLSDDADRVPIEFRAAVFIGDVRATLVRQSPL